MPEFTKRLKRLELSLEALIAAGGFAISEAMPDGTSLNRIWYDPVRCVLNIVLSHPDWEWVPEACEIPLLTLPVGTVAAPVALAEVLCAADSIRVRNGVAYWREDADTPATIVEGR